METEEKKQEIKVKPEPRKIRLLAYTSSPTVPTGFGMAAREIFTRLYGYGQRHDGEIYPKYDFQIVGIDFKGDDKNPFPFHICLTNDEWGVEKLVQVIKRERFDVFFIMQDLHVFGMTGRDRYKRMQSVVDMMNQIRPETPIVTYFPVDRSPVPSVYIERCLRKCDMNFVQSEFGKREIEKAIAYYGGDPLLLETVPNGINTEIFRPLPSEDRERIRKEWRWEGRFVIANINRFQPRKNVPSTLRAAALFGEGYKICECGNYYSLKLDRCDLCMSEKFNGIHAGNPDMVLYLHMNVREPSMGGSELDFLNNHVASAGFSNDSGRMVLITDSFGKNKLTPEDINTIYNCADVFLTTTFGEGVGLTVLEAMATGTRVIAPKHSAILEYAGNSATLIPNAAIVGGIPGDMAAQRPVVSVPRVVDALHEEYDIWLTNGRKKMVSQACVDRAKKFSWDECVKKLDKAFTFILGKRLIYRGVVKL